MEVSNETDSTLVLSLYSSAEGMAEIYQEIAPGTKFERRHHTGPQTPTGEPARSGTFTIKLKDGPEIYQVKSEGIVKGKPFDVEIKIGNKN